MTHHALGLLYTVTTSAGPVSPRNPELTGHLIGIPDTIVVVSALTRRTIPLEFLLNIPRRVAAA